MAFFRSPEQQPPLSFDPTPENIQAYGKWANELLNTKPIATLENMPFRKGIQAKGYTIDEEITSYDAATSVILDSVLTDSYPYIDILEFPSRDLRIAPLIGMISSKQPIPLIGVIGVQNPDSKLHLYGLLQPTTMAAEPQYIMIGSKEKDEKQIKTPFAPQK